MPGHDQLRANCFQLINGRWNNRLEDTAGEMQSPQQCIYGIDAGKIPSVTNELMAPAWPQPVSTTSPLSRTLTTNAWSSWMSGSDCHSPLIS